MPNLNGKRVTVRVRREDSAPLSLRRGFTWGPPSCILMQSESLLTWLRDITGLVPSSTVRGEGAAGGACRACAPRRGWRTRGPAGTRGPPARVDGYALGGPPGCSREG